MHTLRVHQLEKSYPSEQTLLRFLRRPFAQNYKLALRGVDLMLAAGHIYGLIGPNGAGKTTLLKLLGGLVEASSGSIQLDGEDLAGRPTALRARVRMVVADERSFFWRLSLRENLRFFATLEGLSGKKREERVHTCLSQVALEERAHEPFRALSTGMRQRLALARGLLADPEVLLLDEATRSLDPEAAAEVRRLIRRLSQERADRAILWSSHDLREIEGFCSDVIVLREGAVVEQSPIPRESEVQRWQVRVIAGAAAATALSTTDIRLVEVSDESAVFEVHGPQTLEGLLERTKAQGYCLLSVQPLRLDLSHTLLCRKVDAQP